MAAFFIVVAITVIVLAAVLLFAVVASRDGEGIAAEGRRHAKLATTGEAAPAVIRRMWSTGASLSEANPQLGLVLEVHPSGAPPYEAETSTFIADSQVSHFQPGETVTVRYDPHHPKNVAIESGGEPDLMEELSDLLKSIDVGQMLRDRLAEQHTPRDAPGPTTAHAAGGALAPARILRADETGTLVNGTTPLVRFELEVEPEGGAAFTATIEGVIPPGSLAKYQAGSTVWVRYERSTPTWVAFDRS